MSRLAQSGNAIDDFWRGFESFLKQTNNHRSTQVELSPEKRIHAMKSLAALAKYIGCYDRWQQIRQKFQLKWSNADPIHDFSLILNDGKDIKYMLSWVTEACMAIGLIHTNSNNYINQSSHTLEHFRFRFIRLTNKAYISIYNDRIIELANDTSKDITYSFLKYLFIKYGLSLNTSFCSKIFATYLRTHGIEQEIIDLLQGRAPKSVFARHYFRPDLNYDKIGLLLDSLGEMIIHS